MSEIDDYDRGKSFDIRLLMSHPTMHPDTITTSLSIQPTRSWNAGESRTSPNGASLSGVYRETKWSRDWTFLDNRLFFRALMKVFSESLEGKSEFFLDFLKTGGVTVLTVDAKGSVNIGDVLAAADMRRLASAGIDIGLEVFPGE